LAAGGLCVLGTERHESRRIDNQLRGRSGRQGDPGRSRFFLSLEDDLMRIFGSDQLGNMLTKLGLKENEAIIHPWINKALEKAQSKVEARNFDIRKNLLKYDDVMNDQRKVVFEQRIDLMREADVSATVADMRYSTVEDLVRKHIPENAYPEQWDTNGLKAETETLLGLNLPIEDWIKEEGIADEEVRERIVRAADETMAGKVAKYGAEIMRYVEKSVLLQTLDHLWREHLVMLEHLRQVVGLRGYGQRDPLQEYKREGYEMFMAMVERVKEESVSNLFRVQLARQQGGQRQDQDMEEAQELADEAVEEAIEQTKALEETKAQLAPRRQQISYSHGGEDASAKTVKREGKKVGRNDPCPCGSGKKYKKCCGK